MLCSAGHEAGIAKKRGRLSMTIKSVIEYEKEIAASRDQRMAWWREGRFGMFVHYGLYTVLQRHEWVMALENMDIEEYEKLADQLKPREGVAREWAKLAKEAGMKYMVLTTRHHEGFSLWDSKVNPYNSVNFGPKRDLVKEFVEACREFDLKVGFYSSVMDWHHPDGGKCAYDREARIRYTNYIKELNRELMTNYGKIDVLWYDVPAPMDHFESWNSLEMNQMVRELQPEIIINNRSLLDEDFGTPEEHITAMDRDWEACMTFNGISWGYMDSNKVKPYSYTPHQIIKMLTQVTSTGGNLLLNIGPTIDGSVPEEVIEPLTKVGLWLQDNGKAIYGHKTRFNDTPENPVWLNGLSSLIGCSNKCYLVNFIWPKAKEITLGGVLGAQLKKVTLLSDNREISFKQDAHRVKLIDLQEDMEDKHLGITVFELEFDQEPDYKRASCYPALHRGMDYRKIYK